MKTNFHGGMSFADLKEFLDFKANEYNNPKFIESDPIQLAHRFQEKEDIEIVGFLMATIAWGNRKSIITSGERILTIMEHDPYNFIRDFKRFVIADEIIGIVFHDGQNPFTTGNDRFAISPSNRCHQKTDNFNIFFFLKTVSQFNRIRFDEFRIVVFIGFEVEKFFEIGKRHAAVKIGFHETISPSCIVSVRSAISANWLLCVTITKVCPISRRRSKNNWCNSLAFFESRFPEGSSAKTTLGLLTKALATATRCCSPPESADG